MSDDFNFERLISNKKPDNPLADSIYIAIRDAEIYGTDLIVQERGQTVRLSPAEMRDRLEKKL